MIERSPVGKGTPLDILFVGSLVPVHRAGTGVVGTELVAGLAAAGHRLRTLAPRTPHTIGRSEHFQSQYPDVEAAWYPIPILPAELPLGTRDPSYRQAEDAGIRSELPRRIAERRPDVIVIGRESSVAEAAPVAWRHGIPTVAIVHGGRTFLRVLDHSPDAWAHQAREGLRHAEVVVVVAHHLRETLAPLSLPRVTVIPNPVDLDRFTPGDKPPDLLRAHAIRPDDVVVAHLSNLSPTKRPLDVIESAARVLAEDPRVVYLIVGDGPNRAPMEARCRELGIAHRVRFAGWVEHAVMPGYLRVADIVVMPSEHEGMPCAYLETQASGRLLVASDIPATREVVVDGETGLIARRGDVEHLAATTLRGVRDPALRAAIGRAARTAVHAHAKPAVVAAYAGILEELAAATTSRVQPRRSSGLPGAR